VTDHKTMSYLQVTYDSVRDCRCSMDEGLDSLSDDGWELVTSYPTQGYVPEAVMFVFRRKRAR
jgi:hypothetical protein